MEPLRGQSPGAKWAGVQFPGRRTRAHLEASPQRGGGGGGGFATRAQGLLDLLLVSDCHQQSLPILLLSEECSLLWPYSGATIIIPYIHSLCFSPYVAKEVDIYPDVK